VVCVGERYNRSGKRLLLRIDDEIICSVPPQWTDLVAVAPEISIAQGRASLRFEDLLELACLVACLCRAVDASARCKGNDAAYVKTNTPQEQSGTQS
jgi:hypothetical protein